MKRRSSWIASLLALLATFGCGDQERTVRIIAPVDTGAALAATQGPVDDAGGARLGIRRADAFHSHLVDAEGRSLYIFTADADAEGSACEEACLDDWPPYLTYGEPHAAEPAVDELLIGTIARDEEAVQVTYDGAPLYYSEADDQPGETAGHGIESYGGEWLLVNPEGEPIRANVDGY